MFLRLSGEYESSDRWEFFPHIVIGFPVSLPVSLSLRLPAVCPASFSVCWCSRHNGALVCMFKIPSSFLIHWRTVSPSQLHSSSPICVASFLSQLYLLLSPRFSSHVSISAGRSIYESLQRGGQAAGVTTFPDGISELISPESFLANLLCDRVRLQPHITVPCRYI